MPYGIHIKKISRVKVSMPRKFNCVWEQNISFIVGVGEELSLKSIGQPLDYTALLFCFFLSSSYFWGV